jgi:hypothetical protein
LPTPCSIVLPVSKVTCNFSFTMVVTLYPLMLIG